MKLNEIKIGGTFWAEGRPYLCTDVGSRSVVGVELINASPDARPEGPPYDVPEVVFTDELLERANLT